MTERCRNCNIILNDTLCYSCKPRTPIGAIIDDVLSELENAVIKFPTWPSRVMDAAAIVGEESGELIKASLQVTYEKDKETIEGVRKEAIQTAAMCIRFILSINEYDCNPGDQHNQNI